MICLLKFLFLFCFYHAQVQVFFLKKKTQTFFSLESTWSFQDVTQTWEWNHKKRQNDINWNLLDSYTGVVCCLVNDEAGFVSPVSCCWHFMT